MARNIGNRNPGWHHCFAQHQQPYLAYPLGQPSTIGAMAKGRSPNFHINLSVRHTYTILSSTLVVRIIIYIPSADNSADPISRGEVGPLTLKLQTSFTLQEELQPFFINAR